LSLQPEQLADLVLLLSHPVKLACEQGASLIAEQTKLASFPLFQARRAGIGAKALSEETQVLERPVHK
jgi:hypothetical protein